MNELSTLNVNSVLNTVTCVHHSFSFSQDFIDNSHLGERYMGCSIKIQNKSPHKYIVFSPDSYYLSLIGSGI